MFTTPRTLLVGVVMATALAGVPAMAQVSDARLNALLQSVADTCAATPSACEQAIETAMGEIQAAGGNPSDINRQVGAVVNRVSEVYEQKRAEGTLTAADQGALAGAIATGGNSFVDNPDDPEERARLQSAAATIASNVSTGSAVDDRARTIAVSGTAS